MTIRTRLHLRSLTARIRTATRAYAVQQLADYAATIDPTATWSRPMPVIVFRPHVPERDPRASSPDDIVLDGVPIGTVVKWNVGKGPMFTATVYLNPEARNTHLAKSVCGAGETPELAVLKALSDGIKEHATCLAQAQALEARLCWLVPA